MSKWLYSLHAFLACLWLICAVVSVNLGNWQLFATFALLVVWGMFWMGEVR